MLLFVCSSLFVFDALDEIGEVKKPECTIIINLQAVLHVLLEFNNVIMRLGIHPYLQHTQILFYFDSHSIDTGCYFPGRTDQSEHCIFPQFVGFLFFDCYFVIAAFFVLGVFPQGFDALLEQVELILYICDIATLGHFAGLYHVLKELPEFGDCPESNQSFLFLFE